MCVCVCVCVCVKDISRKQFLKEEEGTVEAETFLSSSA